MTVGPSPFHLVPFALLALIPMVLWLVGLALAILVIVWIYQIRKATQETAEETRKLARTMNDLLYRLMRDKNEEKNQE